MVVVDEEAKISPEFAFKLELYQSSEARASTFVGSWQDDGILDVNDLAQAGFVCSGKSRTIVCVACKIAIDKWHEGDSPLGLHFAYSPHCIFVTHLHPSSAGSPDQTNEQAAAEASMATTSAKIDKDKQGQYNCKICKERESNILSLPCCHIVVCVQCAKQSVCPSCGAGVGATKRVFTP